MKLIKKSLLSLVLTFLMTSSIVTNSVVATSAVVKEENSVSATTNAETVKATYSGQCGANAYWNLDTETGLLTISGSGGMHDCSHGNAPWYSNKDYIKEVVVENGITKIGTYVFSDCTSLISITIPNSVENIDFCSFYGCTSLYSITIPNNVKNIDYTAFYVCTGLTNITVDENNTVYKSVNGVLYNNTEINFQK